MANAKLTKPAKALMCRGIIWGYKVEASPGIEPGYADLQSAASPLRHEASVRRYMVAAGRHS